MLTYQLSALMTESTIGVEGAETVAGCLKKSTRQSRGCQLAKRPVNDERVLEDDSIAIRGGGTALEKEVDL